MKEEKRSTHLELKYIKYFQTWYGGKLYEGKGKKYMFFPLFLKRDMGKNLHRERKILHAFTSLPQTRYGKKLHRKTIKLQGFSTLLQTRYEKNSKNEKNTRFITFPKHGMGKFLHRKRIKLHVFPTFLKHDMRTKYAKKKDKTT